MSVHAIYRKSKPTAPWHLVSVVASQEMANQEVDLFEKQEKNNGNEQAKVAIQLFDTLFYIPENLTEIKEYKPIFN
jgi:hypothetical protein